MQPIRSRTLNQAYDQAHSHPVPARIRVSKQCSLLNRFGLSLKLRIASSDVCSDILTANGDRFGLDSAEQDRAHDERSVRWRTEAFAHDFGL